MANIPLFTGFYTPHVVQDFFHQQYSTPQKPQREKPSSKRRWLHVLAAKPQLLHDMEAEKESAIQVFRQNFWIRKSKKFRSEYSMLDTLQGTNISHLGKRKTIFKSALVGNMLVLREGITNNGSGNRVFFLAGHDPKMKPQVNKLLRSSSDFSGPPLKLSYDVVTGQNY